MNGIELTTKLRERLRSDVPIVILTGDISTGTLRDIADKDYVQLNKPVKLAELVDVIQRLLSTAPAPAPRARVETDLSTASGSSAAPSSGSPVVFVVDDDSQVREAIRETLEEDGQIVEDYASCEEFLEVWRPGREACLVIDAYLPGMSGLELLRHLKETGHQLPAIMITGNGDVSIAVAAMKAGASDFIEKPIGHDELLACIARAIEQGRDSSKRTAWRADAASHMAGLTARQREIMALVLAGHPSKNIAADLGISQRTVENHRASIMKKTGSRSVPALARLAVAAEGEDGRIIPLKR
jgi:two-component system CheB/CheR fusion protein